jgi:diguanylate cyclase (GGDEF)-like protein
MLRVFFPSSENQILWQSQAAQPTPVNASLWRRLFGQRGNHDRHAADRQIERQTSVAQFSQLALSGISLTELFQTTAQIVAKTLTATQCRVWQVQSDRASLRSMAIVNLTITAESPAPISYGVSGITHTGVEEILRATAPMHFDGTNLDSGTNPSLLTPLDPPEQTCGVAILVPGQSCPLGLLEVYRSSQHPFQTDELAFLEALSRMLGIAIERHRTDGLLQTRNQILEQVTSGAPLNEIFNCLCLLIEAQAPDSICTIIQLDETGRQLVVGAAPTMSPEWIAHIEALTIGDTSNACSQALDCGKPMFVNEVDRSVWSTPFLGPDGGVLGTFAMTHRSVASPTAFHHQLIKTATHLASIACESRRTVHQLQRQAMYDGLTGLPNRGFFMRYLAEQLETPDQSFALLFLDVDHFKLVNDSMGHNAGDQLLIAITQRLKPCIRRTDTFSRLGGDEFAIVLEGVPTVEQAQSIAEQIKAVLSLPFQILDREVFASVSIGISHSDNLYSTPEEILRDADIAMYRAKALGRSQSATFDKAMHSDILDRMQMEMELRRVVDQLFLDGTSPLYLNYQPIVSLVTGRIAGFEALIRWDHPERGLISPLDFIPIAEETGLIVPIGQWVLQEACQQLHQWQEELAMPDLMMSVNVSSRQFLQVDFILSIQQMLYYTQIQPACLKLEITESVLMETAKIVTDRLEQLRELGVRLSLDDFGTGYSSLSYLHQFPINTLKVDRSFVSNLADDQDQVVQAIVALTHGLDMDAVAEGIETLAQLHHLQLLGCEYGQGYLFSRPVSHEKARQLLIDNPQWSGKAGSVLNPSVIPAI